MYNLSYQLLHRIIRLGRRALVGIQSKRINIPNRRASDKKHIVPNNAWHFKDSKE